MKNNMAVIITSTFIALMSAIYGGVVCVFIIHPQPYKLSEYEPAPKPETATVSNERAETAWNNIQLKCTDKRTIDWEIENYSVSENGQIAVLSHNDIFVYNADHSFAQSFSHKANGAEYIAWDGDNIVLIRVRSDIAVHFDTKGKLKKVENLPDDYESVNCYKKYLRSDIKKYGQVTYESRRMSIVSEKLVAIDSNGNEQVLCESSIMYIFRNVVFVIFMLVFPIIVCYGIISYTVNLNEQMRLHNQYVLQKNTVSR